MALEAYVEQGDNVALLQRCGAELAQVQGVLRVMEIHGAALLAEEMTQVTRYLQTTGGRTQEPGRGARCADARHRAAARSYLDRVLAGGRDWRWCCCRCSTTCAPCAAARCCPKARCCSLNLQVRPAGIARGTGGRRRGRHRVAVGAQAALALPDGPASAGSAANASITHLDAIAAVATRFEKVATTQPLFQLWWVVGALVEALRDRGLEGGVSVKRLLGLADREIKRLYDEGEDRYAQNPPVELLNNLLYYVARATAAGPRVRSVRRLVPARRTAAGGREHRAGTREPFRAVHQADADGGRGHPRRPVEGQGRAGHLRAPRWRCTRRAGLADRSAAQDRRHARRAGPRRTARARAGRDREARGAGGLARETFRFRCWWTSPQR